MLHLEKASYASTEGIRKPYQNKSINPMSWPNWLHILVWSILVLICFTIDLNILTYMHFNSFYIIPLVYGVFFGLSLGFDLGLILSSILNILVRSEGLKQGADWNVLIACLLTLGTCSLLSRLLVKKSERERSLLFERDSLNEQLIYVFAKTIEYKDEYTMGHSVRVADYAVKIATEMKLTPHEIERVYVAGILHDIGKIGVKDYILKKPGALSQSEWERVRDHVNLGVRILQGIGGFSDVTDMIADHHERWDGKGYPLAKATEEITLGGRILAVADAYDAMTTLRAYRKPFSSVEAEQELKRCANAQFDPDVVEAFIRVLSESELVEHSCV